MKDNQEKLYEAFGELLYVVAMADGLIQESEISALEKVLATHPWAADIKWSFEYERKKQSSVEEVYAKVLDYCTYVGPQAEYQNMLDVMDAMAKASEGIDENEQKVINTFVHTLTERFRNDIEKLG
ncbi:TerB family tellurite resistance protein [Aureispira anguillae]|uniref:TerB family tellurite resistance protein n=1 Tax=Aureispira anguillae TaxID=2864201 RepID=A0A915YGB0_9BACT|nr:TerB family tellurite resistance protein [Aureispira anguillae]BDS12563.1 TerB family tellurite resistance protein [Aureispira anguillae]